MKKYRVSYTITGQVEVEAENSCDAARIVKGSAGDNHNIDGTAVTDQELISGLEGYDDKQPGSSYNIEAEAIIIIHDNIEEIINYENKGEDK